MPSASRKLPEAWRASRTSASSGTTIDSASAARRRTGRDLLDARPLEVEAVAAVDHRRRDLLGVGRREDEERVRRRLLERLEKRVPGRRREHVSLVEDVDLAVSGDRREADRLAQRADVVDRVRGGGVHLGNVERGRRGDRRARLADAARVDRRAALAVEAGGEDLRHRRLAGAARADEQVGVVDAIALDGVAQRPHHVVLTDHLGEGTRAVAAVERGASGHGKLSLPRCASASETQ
jgi:hypothetical protein